MLIGVFIVFSVFGSVLEVGWCVSMVRGEKVGYLAYLPIRRFADLRIQERKKAVFV